MKQGKALFQLQEIDLTISTHLKRIAEIQTQLEDNQAVQTAKSRLEKAEALLSPLQTQLRDLELQTQSAQTKRKSTEERLYSGTVTNPKELEDMQREITSLKGRQSNLEEQTLDLMLQIDEAQTQIDEAQTNLNDIVEAAEAENADLIEERETLHAEVDALKSQRQTTLADITSDNINTYERLRPQKANRPIGRLTPDDTCSACGIKQNNTVAKAIKQGEDLTPCINCKRILVYF